MSTAFKDRIDAALVRRLGAAIAAADGSFEQKPFERDAARGLDGLELKARIAHVAAALEQHLPRDVEQAAAVIGDVVTAVERGDTELEGWELWPVTDWVARVGRGNAPIALELLAGLTRHATGEFAVRPFIDDDPAGVLARFDRWIDERDEHARRLVSEGTRPRLPWAPRLVVAAAEPGYAVALLDRLVADPSEYVRRSVSNHLNDLTRLDTELALAVAGRWADQAAAADAVDRARIDWVIRRGLRSLVKHGDPDALRLLGHDPDAAIDATGLVVHTPVVHLGEAATWTVELCSTDSAAHRIVVDYAIHFVRADGSTGRKVFKWTTFELGPGDRRTLERRHAIRPITTRTYRSGTHLVEVQVNGVVVASGSFELVVPPAA